MKIHKGVLLLAAFAVSGAGAAPDRGTAVGDIVCFSDSAPGMEVAEAAARFLADRRQERHYAKSFVVADREDKFADRFLILILSPEGEGAFKAVRPEFEDSLLALLQKMKKHFGDDKVRVILQRPDMANVLEACFDAGGAGTLKGLDTPSPAADSTPPPSPSPKL